jgi:hypothetical protein
MRPHAGRAVAAEMTTEGETLVSAIDNRSRCRDQALAYQQAVHISHRHRQKGVLGVLDATVSTAGLTAALVPLAGDGVALVARTRADLRCSTSAHTRGQ